MKREPFVVRRTYLKLRVNQGDLEIQVPLENVDMVGVRDRSGEDGLEEVHVSPAREPATGRAASRRTGEKDATTATL